ncbi:hypothetical protein [Psychrobacillus sp. OK032]|uniref:hypothetical protein n=1 Tax=Psychrobacillus sp. OK032 TaxID=1884358 RepID=UPI0008B0B4DE|nr:hypothetical protein [Psychrobacillus sp. OK032]SER51399.1 hypothetical protein SAMN05518872_10110 [Psychrobacillus sp. OK032]
MLKRIFVVFSALLVLSGGLFSFSSTSYASTTEFEDLRAQKKMIKAAEKISSYFSVDENENIIFNADRDTLVNELGVSEEDADLMIQAATELVPSEEPQMQAYGFVGVHLNLGPKVRGMSGWAAGAFAGGYVGWYAKTFAVNPVTAGVAALITASTVLVVKDAVEKNLKRVSIGSNIPGLSLAYNVDIP